MRNNSLGIRQGIFEHSEESSVVGLALDFVFKPTVDLRKKFDGAPHLQPLMLQAPRAAVLESDDAALGQVEKIASGEIELQHIQILLPSTIFSLPGARCMVLIR